MRHNSFRLAFFFILITITRVAMFVAYGLQIGWMGYAFAVGLAAGVYLTAYFLRFKETKTAAGIALTFFLIADLWFNEFENIRTVSVSTLIDANANFMNFDAETIRYGMQFSALVFGAFPTIAAALLGWLQSGAERVQVLRHRNWFGKLGTSLSKAIEASFPEVSDVARVRPVISVESVENSTKQLPLQNRKVRWNDIPKEQRSQFPNMTDEQIVLRYGGTTRRARMWRQWVREGK